MPQKKSLYLLLLSIVLFSLTLLGCPSGIPEVSKNASPGMAITAGVDHSMILKEDGTVWVAGSNAYGQLGLGADESDRTKFTQVTTDSQGNALANVTAIASGDYHSMILKEDGSVWVTGSNTFPIENSKQQKAGQLGLGDEIDELIKFTQIPTESIGKIQTIAAGAYHSMLLAENGTLWATGANSMFDSDLGNQGASAHYYPSGQLGLKSADLFIATFSQVDTESFGIIQAISAGAYHSLLLTEDNKLFRTGKNEADLDNSQSLVNSYIDCTPTEPTPITVIDAGTSHSLIIGDGGTGWAKGSNGSGQLGIDSNNKKADTFFQAIQEGSPSSVTNVKAISAGTSHSLILKENGTVWSAGMHRTSSLVGQLGIGEENTSHTINLFTQVTKDSSSQPIAKVQAINTGGNHSLILTEDGKVLTTGRNYKGQLGIGNTTTAGLFTEVIYE